MVWIRGIDIEKRKLIVLGATLLVSAAALMTANLSNDSLMQPTVAQAASKKKRLYHNAAVYNSKGRRVHVRTLKKGRRVRIYGSKTIKGKKYYRVGKNKYVKVANFTQPKKKADHKKALTGLALEIKKNSFKDPVMALVSDEDYVSGNEPTVEVKAMRDTKCLLTGKTFKAGTVFWLTGVYKDKDRIGSFVDGPDSPYSVLFDAKDLKFTGYNLNKDPKIKKMNAEIKSLQNDGDSIDIFPNSVQEPVYQYDTRFNLLGKATPFSEINTEFNECAEVENTDIVPVKINGEYYYYFN